MSGRIIGEDGNVRFVELSLDFDSYYKVVDQTVVAFSSWPREAVTFQKRDDEGKVVTFQLTSEEMTTLVQSYQTYLQDQEARRAIPASGGYVDDDPFGDPDDGLDNDPF